MESMSVIKYKGKVNMTNIHIYVFEYKKKKIRAYIQYKKKILGIYFYTLLSV